MVNNSTNINKNHPSHQLIEWCQQFHQYQQKSLLTSTHWMMVNNSTNINKITSHLDSLSDGQQFHQYQPKSHLTSNHWAMVNNSTNINKNHLSPQLIEWWSTIPPISTKITSHLNSLSDGQQFHKHQQTSPLTSTHWVMVNNSTTNIKNSPLYSTHWVMVNNSTNINKNHLTPQFIKWWSTIPPISTKIISHFNSLSDGQQFHQYQINYLSPQLIEWWSTIPPISTTITSHLNSLSDGQQLH